MLPVSDTMRAAICERLWTNSRRAVPIIWVDMLTTTVINRSLMLIRGLEFTVWLLLVSITGAGFMPGWMMRYFAKPQGNTPAVVLAWRLVKLFVQWAMFRLILYPLNGIVTFLVLDFMNVRMSISNRWLPVLSVLPPVVVYLACQLLEECVHTGATPVVENVLGRNDNNDENDGEAPPVVNTAETINDVAFNNETIMPTPTPAQTTTTTPEVQQQNNNATSSAPTPLEQMKRLCRLLPEPPMSRSCAARSMLKGSQDPAPVQLPVVQLTQPPTMSVSAAPTFAQRVASALACMRRQMSLRVINADDTLAARPPTNTEWDTYLDRYWRIHQILPPPTQRDSKSVTAVWTSSKALGEDWSIS